MAEIIKELSGHSGSKIYLMKDEEKLFVRKIGNVDRNYSRMKVLNSEGYSLPEVYTYEDETLDMEYIHGLDIKTYLTHNIQNQLTKFIKSTLTSFSSVKMEKDYTQTYYDKLKWMDDCTTLPFTKEELISKLPKILPCTTYHGDLTLENIMYSRGKFYMIDPMQSPYDSYIFDIAKMRQDLQCKWFLRHTDIKLDTKISSIQSKILNVFPEANNDYLLILMLLRVYPYTKSEFDNQFILREINKLWK